EASSEYIDPTTIRSELSEISEDALMIREAIGRLSEEEQEIIELYFLQELSAKEIAVFFESTEPTVKMRVHRAKQKLRDEVMNPGSTSPAQSRRGTAGGSAVFFQEKSPPFSSVREFASGLSAYCLDQGLPGSSHSNCCDLINLAFRGQ